MIVLGIESSFDDTGVAIVRADALECTSSGRVVEKDKASCGSDGVDIIGAAAAVATDMPRASGCEGRGVLLGEGRITQRGQHAESGGTVPRRAAELHAANLPVALERALAEAGLGIGDVDAVACTVGPGLGPCESCIWPHTYKRLTRCIEIVNA